VPLFLGDLGAYKACCSNGEGGLAWVSQASRRPRMMCTNKLTTASTISRCSATDAT